MAFAVRATGNGHTIGIILLVVGAVGALLSMIVWSSTGARGYARRDVRIACQSRIPCHSHGEAKELALRLAADGYGVVRGWSYVIADTETREQADRLTKNLYGQFKPGGELVWGTTPVWSRAAPLELAS